MQPLKLFALFNPHIYVMFSLLVKYKYRLMNSLVPSYVRIHNIFVLFILPLRVLPYGRV